MEGRNQELAGRRVVITGAGRGLGRALAIVAADHGADVDLLGRGADKLQQVADAIRVRSQRDAAVIPCDLASPDSIASASDTILANNGSVDVLINNGAPWLTGSLEETSESDIVATVGAAVSGTILLTRRLLPGLRCSESADIVTVVSTAGFLGWNSNGAAAAFYAAKHGQSGFSDRLRHELKEQGIRVSAIYPPDFDELDPLDDAWNEPEDAKRMTNREIVSTIMHMITAPRSISFPVVVVDGME
jgi:NAD(P)-dependent dehydrogenase (short-subunit alcohol dehydrogenase family)